ncbi:pentapeptide repeat-containing protein [Catalinimonas niigatensis]|uniref:pentapeptide repeat-containing protein n=1 Tax=Catalinimonas niigatensis TaxID=1397264 RepID=UPI002665C461|nr:pentapeptide repeat-containing protein [Catalinimonas niigatensis]WPP50854.1 pentapeptide repeat-containing protein [Catalinimonas niigatensis]
MKTNSLILALFLLIGSQAYAQKTVRAEDIIAQINRGEVVDYENVKVSGVLDLTNLENQTSKRKGDGWFGSNKQYESTVENSIRFIKCTFLDDVLAYYNEDDDTYIAHFEEDVLFEQCVFERASEFKYSDFEEKASFARTVFNREANFKYAEFADGPDFSGSIFEEDANFKYADFSDQPQYADVVFEEEANFKYAKFPDGVSFESAVFNDLANFKYTKFSSPLNINNVSFNGGEDFKYTEIDGQAFTTYLIRNR